MIYNHYKNSLNQINTNEFISNNSKITINNE